MATFRHSFWWSLFIAGDLTAEEFLFKACADPTEGPRQDELDFIQKLCTEALELYEDRPLGQPDRGRAQRALLRLQSHIHKNYPKENPDAA